MIRRLEEGDANSWSFITLNLSNEDAITLIKPAGGKSTNQYPLKQKEALKQNFKGDESLFEWDY